LFAIPQPRPGERSYIYDDAAYRRPGYGTVFKTGLIEK
jgi:hypothetical protein